MGFMDFMDLDKLEDEVKNGAKIVYDIFCTSFFKLMEGKDREKILKDMSKDQVIQLVNWLNDHALPFYESLEEYEKCAKIKGYVSYLKQVKQI